MVTYFFLSLLLICVIFIPLYFFLAKRGKHLSILNYSGFFYILMGIPLLATLLVYIGIGSCLIGIVLIALRNVRLSKTVQAIISISPILLLSAFSFYSEPSNNTFLIPKDYRGRIVIIHSCKNGADREFEKLSRIYKIPKSGILKTKFSFAGNAFDSLHSKYYFIDPSGNREEISFDTSKVHPQGIWTLSYTKKGDTVIDFIVDVYQENPNTYQAEKNEFYQTEIDSCLE